jgi:hypothetical protein
MKIQELIDELNALHPEIKETVKAEDWMTRRITPGFYGWSHGKNYSILDFESVGRALKIIEPILGKPQIHKQLGKAGTTSSRFTHTQFDWYWRGMDDANRDISRMGEVTKKLHEAGISYFFHENPVWLSIDIPAYVYLSSFKGDDPKVWRMRQKRREEAVEKTRKTKLVEDKLDNV